MSPAMGLGGVEALEEVVDLDLDFDSRRGLSPPSCVLVGTALVVVVAVCWIVSARGPSSDTITGDSELPVEVRLRFRTMQWEGGAAPCNGGIVEVSHG